MTSHSAYEEQPFREEIGEATLQLDHLRDRYLILFDGEVYTGGCYDGNTMDTLPLVHQGEQRGVRGKLFALVPEYPGSVDPETQRQVDLGWASAHYYVEDRALMIQGPGDPTLGEDDLVELSALFERFVKHRFPAAATIYRLENRIYSGGSYEAILRRLGYRLVRENRRKAGGGHYPHPMPYPLRTWAK